MKHLSITAIFVLLLILIFAAPNISPPFESNQITVRSSSKFNFVAKAYIIPDGNFRGVLWPHPNEHQFEIWVVSHHDEYFFKVPAPTNLFNTEAQTTDHEWNFSEIRRSGNSTTFQAWRTDNAVAFEIDLPTSMSTYGFSCFKNDNGQEIVIFLDPSNSAKSRLGGNFAYVLIDRN